MPLSIDIQTNYKRQAAQLRIDGQQLPKVLASALSAHAFDAVGYQRDQMPKDIDRPTPFTLRALAYTRATTSKLESSVYVRPVQAEYLARLIEPGKRVPLRNFVFVPSRSQQTNPYGNMPRGKRRRTLSDPKINTINRGASKLVFLTVGKQRQFLGVFVLSTNYSQQRWHFHEHAITHYDRRFEGHFGAAWNRLLTKQR